MRILYAVTALAIACGAPPKKQSSIVEGDVPQACCCKTIPQTAEKEIVPVYAQSGRMECSSNHGDCVDDVQCAGEQAQPTGDGTPLQPSTGGIGDH